MSGDIDECECDFCGKWYERDSEKCPHCGATWLDAEDAFGNDQSTYGEL